MHLEKDKDTLEKNINRTVICFDLENVINLPKSEVAVLSYKQKLNVYNLTAYCGGQIYCAIWSETVSGRAGNDLASALVRILVHILVQNPHIKEIVTWSNSCVRQNPNSLMSTAIIIFCQKIKTACYNEIFSPWSLMCTRSGQRSFETAAIFKEM